MMDDPRDIYPLAPISASRIALQQRKVGYALCVDRAAFEIDPDPVTDMLRCRMSTYVLAEKLVGDTQLVTGEIPFPTSPWQLFKQRHAGAWWLGWLVARRPVRTSPCHWGKTVRLERYATYPNATILPPAMGAPVIVESFDPA
jgi:hypothetical protein